MNRFLLIILIILGCNYSYAQDIKVKKDIISIDEKEVGKIDEIGDKNFNKMLLSFKDVSGTELFKAEFNQKLISKDKYDRYLVLSKEGSPNTNQVSFEYLSFTLNVKKGIADFLMKKYNFFDANGYNKTSIDDFFNKKIEPIAEKTTTTAPVSNIKYIAREDGNIVDENGVIVGTFTYPEYKYLGTQKITIYDLDNNPVFGLTENNFDAHLHNKTFTLSSYDNKETMMSATDIEYTTVPISLVNLMLEKVTSGGYKLGHTVTDYKKNLKEQNIAALRENPVNIYHKKGYLIDNKGERHDGDLSIGFVPVELEKDKTDPISSSSGMVDVGVDRTANGQKVTLFYVNKKGKNVSDEYRSKENVSFCVEETNKCYKGLAIVGEGAVGAISGGLSGLNFDNSEFMEVLHQGQNFSLLTRTVLDKENENHYVIWKHNEKKGIEVNKSRLFSSDEKSLSKNIKQAVDYLSACGVDESKIKSIDLNNKENLITLIKEIDSCNK